MAEVSSLDGAGRSPMPRPLSPPGSWTTKLDAAFPDGGGGWADGLVPESGGPRTGVTFPLHPPQVPQGCPAPWAPPPPGIPLGGTPHSHASSWSCPGQAPPEHSAFRDISTIVHHAIHFPHPFPGGIPLLPQDQGPRSAHPCAGGMGQGAEAGGRGRNDIEGSKPSWG